MGVIRIEKFTDVNNSNKTLVIEAKGEARAGMFNPNTVTLAKTVNWTDQGGKRRDHPRTQFEGGASRTLTLSLFFDSYEAGDADKDVRKHTKKVADLARFDGNLHRPPVCLVSWGPTSAEYDLPFQGVVSSLTQKFTMFTADGTPVRATVDVTFKEYEKPLRQDQRSPPSSPDRRRTRAVKRGDSLWSIAADVYEDPAQWRPIADANGIANPRELVPGSELIIPALE
ncbi:MAG TPA: LysM peptidoglycan-binding domain-containing protein [Longimicrobium sp.]|jgi:nucleoid-associated protein YgaU